MLQVLETNTLRIIARLQTEGGDHKIMFSDAVRENIAPTLAHLLKLTFPKEQDTFAHRVDSIARRDQFLS